MGYFSNSMIFELFIFFQGFLALYDGNMRNRFIQNYCLFFRDCNDHQNQLDLLILGISISIMLIGYVQRIYFKLYSYMASLFYTCFCYNIYRYHNPQDLIIFLSQIIIVMYAACNNLEHRRKYLQEVLEEKRRSEHYCEDDDKNWEQPSQVRDPVQKYAKKKSNKKHRH